MLTLLSLNIIMGYYIGHEEGGNDLLLQALILLQCAFE